MGDPPAPGVGAGTGSRSGRGGDDPADLARLASVAAALADAVEAALPGWVERSVERFAGPALRDEAAAAGRAAAREIGAELRRLLTTDVDDQRSNPLALLRRAVAYPTRVLADAGVPPVERADFERRAFPDDLYDLSPATWSDIDPALQEPGIVWGAAKAHVVLARRRREGRR